MNQQEQQGGDRPAAPGQKEQTPGDPERRGSGSEATSGRGAAAAMDLLRQRNFRGWRDQPDETPKSE